MKCNLDFTGKDLFIDLFKDTVYVVGGTVRDQLLYGAIRNDRDIDLLVVDHTYQDIEKKLKRMGKTNTVGKSFAVVKFTKNNQTFDISIPRKDTKISKDLHTHKSFSIEAGPHIKLEVDLKRRDFTCNSIACRLIDNELFDPFNGIAAIKKKKLVATGPETFSDDPLRILRGARFASVLQFNLDKDIYKQAAHVKLDELSSERVTDELFRLLLESERPSYGLNEYFKLTVLEKLFPELFTLTLTLQDTIFHPETDEYGHHTVWPHTLIVVDIAKKLSKIYELTEEKTLSLLIAALLHDIGKPATTKWEYKKDRMTIVSPLHDIKGVKIARQFLRKWKIENWHHFPLKRTVLRLIKGHHRIFELHRNQEVIGFKAIARLVKDFDGEDFLLILLDFADRASRNPEPLEFSELDEISKWFIEKKDAYRISRDTIQPLIKGRDLIPLGIEPGVKMGKYLKMLYEKQLDGLFKTREEGLEFFKNWLENNN